MLAGCSPSPAAAALRADSACGSPASPVNWEGDPPPAYPGGERRQGGRACGVGLQGKRSSSLPIGLSQVNHTPLS